jgi:hypothetical protein
LKGTTLLISICLLLSSCTTSSLSKPEPLQAPVIPASSTLSPTSKDTFQVYAWVDKPNPAQDDRVILSGSLIKNGVYLGGMTMQATWPDEAQERGVPNCFVQVIYQRGVCTIDASRYPPDVYVPITVTFGYRDQIYIGHTGFTPR